MTGMTATLHCNILIIIIMYGIVLLQQH